ncbi:AbiV family abortive infection protein [Mesorhizobium opportunistum]|uniref:AbiV family abortive infection protein n=1 Tax=Mesorhizobium opportunistum TaxID=593909 RepID=UPI00333D9DFF
MVEVEENRRIHREAIFACIANGSRLLEETYDLEFRGPPATRLFLAMIAQEEFAKAFMLFLVRRGLIPFSPAVHRAIQDHICKQLMGMIMDYMIMDWETIEEARAMIARDAELGDLLPDDVGSALEILDYEKIGRWTRNNWVWAENPNYNSAAVKIAKGRQDRLKQDALYVRIGSDGRLVSTPDKVGEEDVERELERAKSYDRFVRSAVGMIEDRLFAEWRYDKIMNALIIVFSRPKQEA